VATAPCDVGYYESEETGNCTAVPDAVKCADSGTTEECVCDGTVFYGKRYYDGTSTEIVSLSDMLTSSWSQEESYKSTTCTPSSFTNGDPLYGTWKSCWCAASSPCFSGAYTDDSIASQNISLLWIATDPSVGSLGVCEGDCDYDSDCPELSECIYDPYSSTSISQGTSGVDGCLTGDGMQSDRSTTDYCSNPAVQSSTALCKSLWRADYNSSKCANEAETCTCEGTVYYGRRYASDGITELVNLADVMAIDDYAEADGSRTCSTSGMGSSDPAYGYNKACWCEVVTEQLWPLQSNNSKCDGATNGVATDVADQAECQTLATAAGAEYISMRYTDSTWKCFVSTNCSIVNQSTWEVYQQPAECTTQTGCSGANRKNSICSTTAGITDELECAEYHLDTGYYLVGDVATACTPQTGCSKGSGTTCSTYSSIAHMLVCNTADRGYYMSSGIVYGCTAIGDQGSTSDLYCTNSYNSQPVKAVNGTLTTTMDDSSDTSSGCTNSLMEAVEEAGEKAVSDILNYSRSIIYTQGITCSSSESRRVRGRSLDTELVFVHDISVEFDDSEYNAGYTGSSVTSFTDSEKEIGDAINGLETSTQEYEDLVGVMVASLASQGFNDVDTADLSVATAATALDYCTSAYYIDTSTTAATCIEKTCSKVHMDGSAAECGARATCFNANSGDGFQCRCNNASGWSYFEQEHANNYVADEPYNTDFTVNDCNEIRCLEDQHVVDSACVDCASGSNKAGDYAPHGNTGCDDGDDNTTLIIIIVICILVLVCCPIIIGAIFMMNSSGSSSSGGGGAEVTMAPTTSKGSEDVGSL